MEKAVYNTTRTVGDDVRIKSQWKSDSVPIDFSAFSFQFQLRDSNFTLIENTSLDVTDIATGIVWIIIPRSVSENLSQGKYIGEVVWRDASGYQFASFQLNLNLNRAYTIWVD